MRTQGYNILPLPHVRQDWAHLRHICTGTGLAPPNICNGTVLTHPSHICARTRLTPAFQAA